MARKIQYIKEGSAAWNILRFIQTYPDQAKNTTGIEMAQRISDKYDEQGLVALQTTLSRMVSDYMVYRNDIGTRGHRYNYRINYMHSAIPQEILDNAPASEQASVVRQLHKVSDGQYLSHDGAIVTPNTVEKTKSNGDPFSEDATGEEYTPPEQKETDIYVNESEDVEETSTTTVPLQITKKREDGSTTSATINLTINL